MQDVLLEGIERDLSPFRYRGITLQMVEHAYCVATAGVTSFRVQVSLSQGELPITLTPADAHIALLCQSSTMTQLQQDIEVWTRRLQPLPASSTGPAWQPQCFPPKPSSHGSELYIC